MPNPSQSLGRLREQTSSRIIGIARRMDWYRGLRAATALSTPLLIADFTGLTHLGWTALGGMEAIVSDAGGPYRSRLGRLSVLTLGGALAVFLGTLVGEDLRWALPVTLLFCFVWTYLTVLGQPFASSALLVQVIFICGIGEPETSLKEAGLRAAFLLAGGAWATLLSLFLWPLDPYRPARTAVSQCYQALSGFLESIRQMQAAPHTALEWHQANLKFKVQLRRLIELAWDAVASVRAESAAETAQGRHLIVLLETVDIILERTVALAEHAEAAAQPDRHTPCGDLGLGYATLQPLAEAERWVALLLTRRRMQPQPVNTTQAATVRSTLRGLPDSLESCFPTEDADGRFLAIQIAEIASNLETATETTLVLRGGPTPATTLASGLPFLPGTRRPRPLRERPSIPQTLAANFRRDSLLFRHAARVAIVCGLDVCLIEERHVGHGYWLMMTSLVVLQPHVSGTLRRGLQRIGGTVGGGILAALLAITLHSQLVTGIVLFPLALLALAFLPVNYAAFAFFLTPTFVLAFLRHSGDWQLAALRVGNTIAGAAISIAAMTVLFPSYERERIANYLRASLAANRRYLERLIESWASSTVDPSTLALARRDTGLALNDMEESLERVLAENWARKASTETLLAFAAYLHRFSQSVTGLVALPESLDWKGSPETQSRLTAVLRRLLWLENQLNRTSPQASQTPNTESIPDPWPVLSPPQPHPSREGNPPVMEMPGPRQLKRLERQTRVLHRHLQSMREEPWFRSA